MDIESLELIALGLIVRSKSRLTRRRKPRSLWSREWLKRRGRLGVCETLLKELEVEAPWDYKNWMRMERSTFVELLTLVEPFILKRNTNMRECIPAETRLAVTLRYLATGESQRSLSYSFRIANCTISNIIHETSVAISKVLKPYLVVPATLEKWIQISTGYYSSWQFPNCIESLDGKHIRIAPPPNSGSEFYNYKGFNSIILLAAVNSNYEFIYVDIGTNGRVSDGGVWANSDLKQALDTNSLKIPSPGKLPDSEIVCPYVFVADEAFGLKQNIMRPFPGKHLNHEQQIFNYRLSRARRVVDIRNFG